MTDPTRLDVDVARPADVEAILGLRNDAARWLLSRDIEQWSVDQLRRSVVERRIESGESFVVRAAGDGSLLATLTLDFEDEFTWGDRGRDERAGYLHTIVVSPDRIGEGLGRRFICWAERTILASGRHVARLDCAEGNTELRSFYRLLGYEDVGRRDYGEAWFPVILFQRDLTESASSEA